MKEEDRTSEKYLHETEIRNVPNKQLKVTIIKMLTELRGRIGEHNKNFNRVRKCKKLLNRS